MIVRVVEVGDAAHGVEEAARVEAEGPRVVKVKQGSLAELQQKGAWHLSGATLAAAGLLASMQRGWKVEADFLLHYIFPTFSAPIDWAAKVSSLSGTSCLS